MKRTLICSAILCAFSSTILAQGITNGEHEFDVDTVLNVTETTSDNYVAGIYASQGETLVTMNKGSTLSISGDATNDDSPRLHGVKVEQEASLIVTGKNNIDLKADEEQIRGILVAGTAVINGDTNLTVSNQSGTVSVIKVTEQGELTFNGSLTNVVVNNAGYTLGVENSGKGSVINFNADKTTIPVNTQQSNQDTEGLYLYQSKTNFSGDTTLNVNGGGGYIDGVRILCDDAYVTEANFYGENNEINVSGVSGHAYGLSVSGPTGSVNFYGKNNVINVSSEGGVAYGVAPQYGASVNLIDPDSSLKIIAKSDLEAVGILNTNYGSANTQYGSVNSNGRVDIEVSGSGLVSGIMVNPSEQVLINSEHNGIFLNGSTNIIATGTAVDANVYGIYISNAQGGETSIVANDLTLQAKGFETSQSVGIYAEEKGHVELLGNSTIIAIGENSTGMLLKGSNITISGLSDIEGELIGIQSDKLSEINLTENAHLITNSITNEGTINLANSSVLELTGGVDIESSLDTINAQSADIRVGAGTFKISQLEGDNNSLTLTDLTNVNSVSIGQKSSDLRLVASSASNDQFSSAQEAAKAVTEVFSVEQDEEPTKNTLEVMSGDVNNALTADIIKNSDGTLGLVNVREKKNDKLDAYGSVAALAALSLRHEMNSLSKRMGDLRDAPEGVGVWMRGYGSEMEYGAQDLKMRSKSIQFGTDQSIGDWKVGVAFTYTDGDTSYDLGSADTKGYGVALYGTWFVPCGAYIDLMAKYNRLENDFKLNGMDGDYNSNAYGVSVETGYRFEFMDGGLYLEPQVGLNFGHIEGETIKTSNNVRIDQDNYDSLIGRAGLRAGFKFPKDKGTIYARLSGLYDFDGEVNGTATKGLAHNTIEEDLGGAWVEMGVGANFNWTPNTYTYIDFERTNGGDVKENYRWNVGIRHTF